MISLLLAAAQPVASVRFAFDAHGETAVEVAGLADLATGRAVTPNDPVPVASESKLVVAIRVLRLVEQRRRDFDAPGTFFRHGNLNSPITSVALDRTTERFDRFTDRLVLRPRKLDACFD